MPSKDGGLKPRLYESWEKRAWVAAEESEKIPGLKPILRWSSFPLD
jgi:hypothetical protein